MSEVMKWYPHHHRLTGSGLVSTWGTDDLQLSDITERQTLASIYSLGTRVQLAGRGMGGPFPLATNNGWTSARWVAEMRSDFIMVRWVDRVAIEALNSRHTSQLRLAQVAGWANQLPVFTDEQIQLLRKMQQLEDPFSFIQQLLHRNPTLGLRLVSAANKVSWFPVKTTDQALMVLGGTRALDVLRALIFLTALPLDARLESILSGVTWALQGFEPVFRLSGKQGSDTWSTAICGLVLGETLLDYFVRGKADMYATLSRQIIDIFAVQRFVYGVHALEVCQEIFRHWGIPVDVRSDSEFIQYLGFVADSLPLLRRLPDCLSHCPEARPLWMKKGILMFKEPNSLGPELLPTEQERLLDFFQFLEGPRRSIS